MRFRSVVITLVSIFFSIACFTFRNNYLRKEIEKEAERTWRERCQEVAGGLTPLQKNNAIRRYVHDINGEPKEYHLLNPYNYADKPLGKRPLRWLNPYGIFDGWNFFQRTYDDLKNASILLGIGLSGGEQYTLQTDYWAILATIIKRERESMEKLKMLQEEWDEQENNEQNRDLHAILHFLKERLGEDIESFFDVTDKAQSLDDIIKKATQIAQESYQVLSSRANFCGADVYKSGNNITVELPLTTERIKQKLFTVGTPVCMQTVKTAIASSLSAEYCDQVPNEVNIDKKEILVSKEAGKERALELIAALNKASIDPSCQFAIQQNKKKSVRGKLCYEIHQLTHEADYAPFLTKAHIKEVKTERHEKRGWGMAFSLNEGGRKRYETLINQITSSAVEIALVREGEIIALTFIPLPKSAEEKRNALFHADRFWFTTNEGNDPSKAYDIHRNYRKSGLYVKQVGYNYIAAEMNASAVAKGFSMSIWSLLLIILFMLGYYSVGGLLAITSLLINLLIILGILGQTGRALTMPGMIGLALTLGMAVDATILFFERVREEMLKGIPLSKAIPLGYAKAMPSIIDGNITTLIIGIVMQLMGQGAYHNFGLNLTIGVLCSVFTAFLVTRLFIEWFDWMIGLHRLHFSYEWNKKLFRDTHIDFFEKRLFAYLFSIAILASGVFFTMQHGVHKSIDFFSGKEFYFQYAPNVSVEKIDVTQIKQALQQKVPTSTQVDVRTVVTDNEVTLRIVIPSNSITKNSIQEIISRTQPNFTLVEKPTWKWIQQKAKKKHNTTTTEEQVQELSTTTLQEEEELKKEKPSSRVAQIADINTFWPAGETESEPIMAKEAQRSGIISILLALLLVLFYILFRFKRLALGAAALIALMHDVLIILALYIMQGYEINGSLIIALLTIIGYSINDTIVVFDRLRELLQSGSTQSITKEICNQAINQTLSRTIMTSFTTLLSLVLFYCWGPIFLQPFVFALHIGFIVGTYSSIFIALPMAADMTVKRK